MEPEGILKACITKVLIKSARTRAIIMASVYSRKVDLRLGCAVSSVNDKLLIDMANVKIRHVLIQNRVKHKKKD